jgi:hypothetical protein
MTTNKLYPPLAESVSKGLIILRCFRYERDLRYWLDCNMQWMIALGGKYFTEKKRIEFPNRARIALCVIHNREDLQRLAGQRFDEWDGDIDYWLHSSVDMYVLRKESKPEA